MNNTSSIAERVHRLREEVGEHCTRVGRDPQSVSILAVSKRHSVQAIRQAMEAGLTDFGENYAQELVEKAEQLPQGIRWHYIGQLQKSKIRLLAPHVTVLQTVPSLKLAQALSKRMDDLGRNLEVHLQVNLANEPQKAGMPVDALPPAVQEVHALPHLLLTGLMAIPPVTDDPEDSRPWFKQLRQLADLHGLPKCSMGMSADWRVAIEEGATQLRLGTAIFGPRA